MITYKDYKGNAKLEKSIELWELSNFSLEEVQTDIYLKSVNLQYNTLVRWNDGTKDSSTNCLMLQIYSIVKDSSADLGVNSKIVQIRPTVKAVSTKISNFFFCIFVNILIFLRENKEANFFLFWIFKLKQP